MFEESSLAPLDAEGVGVAAPTKNPIPELAADAAAKMENEDDAAELLLKMLRTKHRALYKEKANEMMHGWARELVRHAKTAARREKSKGQTPAQAQGLSADTIRMATEWWLNWPLSQGMLGDATRPLLLNDSQRYIKSAETQRKRGAWLAAIAEALPDDASKVSDVLNEEAVAKLAAQFGVSAV